MLHRKLQQQEENEGQANCCEPLSSGGADSYLDSGLRRQPQPPPAVVYRIVDGPAALPEGLQPDGRVGGHPPVEQPHEGLGRPSRPVPPAEELVLQVAEEPLAGGVVGRVALAGHGPRQPVALAYGLPPGPAVVASAVGVRDGRLALPERRARHLEGRLGEGRVGAGADGPADGLAVEQVDDGRQVHLRESSGRRNSVTSLTHASLGRAAEKSWAPSARSSRFGAGASISPA